MTNPKPLSDLEQLVDDFKRSALRELHVRHGEFEIYLSKDADSPGLDGPCAMFGQAPAPAGDAVKESASTAAQAPSAATAPAASNLPEGAVLVCAPYLGTFYRSPKPGSPPYVEIGGIVTPESEVCLVEVMKLFTAVRAGIKGRVIDVLAGDGDLVAADQPLFVIAPE